MELRGVNKNIIHISILIFLALFLTAVIRLNYPLLKETSSLSSKNSPNHHSDDLESPERCDIFTGEWVPDSSAPYYTNNTCWAIHEHQNCMKYGRPDSDYLKWKWKPDACGLPDLDPLRFLEMVRGKSMAFVGDSVGRNQMQSMICLLSKVSLFYFILLFLCSTICF